MDTLQKKLEQVKELKQEYGCGSGQALAYLTAKEEYTALRDRVVSATEKDGHRMSLSYPEVSNLCYHTSSDILLGLRLGFVKRMLSKERPLALAKFEIAPYCTPLVRFYEKMKEFQSIASLLSFDYEAYLTQVYLPNFRKERDHTAAFRKSVLEFMEGDYAYLRQDVGDCLTFRQCVQQDWFFVDRDDPMRDEFFPQSLDEYLEENEKFTGFLKFGSERFARKFSRDLAEVATDEKSTFLLEGYFLGSKIDTDNGMRIDIYARAKRDRTLRQLWISRKVALVEVEKNRHKYLDRLIDNTVEELKQGLNDLNEFKENEIEKHEASLHDGLRKSAEERQAEAEYKLWAIHTNRRWLVGMLEL